MKIKKASWLVDRVIRLYKLSSCLKTWLIKMGKLSNCLIWLTNENVGTLWLDNNIANKNEKAIPGRLMAFNNKNLRIPWLADEIDP